MSMMMTRKFVSVACFAVGILLGYVGYAQQKPKADVAINNLATYTVSGEQVRIGGGRFAGTGFTVSKTMTLVTIKYNELTIPCVLSETPQTGNSLVGVGIDCAWPADATAVLTAK